MDTHEWAGSAAHETVITSELLGDARAVPSRAAVGAHRTVSHTGRSEQLTVRVDGERTRP
jgi:hypothetical protein